MGGMGELTEAEQQLLMAAGVHGPGPATDLGRANTARVVNQVLRWNSQLTRPSPLLSWVVPLAGLAPFMKKWSWLLVRRADLLA
jgi:hypothetical protein